MKKEIEYGDWVYLRENKKAYVVRQKFDNTSEAEICANDGERLLRPIDALILITDPVTIQELETQRNIDLQSP